MANLLNFDVARSLQFSVARDLQFDSNRGLRFDHDRPLIFDPNRDLGFGKRGVLFRGFVCANCGALATEDTTACDECGAVFEEPERKGGAAPRSTSGTPWASGAQAPEPAPRSPARPPFFTPPPPPPKSTVAPPATAPPMRAPPPTPGPSTASRFCTNCGARSWAGDAFCWNCGARFGEGQNRGTAKTTAGPIQPSPDGAETLKLPPKKARKVVKDWQETGKSLSEYVEEK